MGEIRATIGESGSAYIDLGAVGEVRHTVALSEHDAVERVPALESIVLHFDFYGRLAGIEITDSADSVLPPALLGIPDA
jgi:hypothetical protein